MKHIKKFNEAVTVDKLQEVKDFCEGYLVYLLDEGFEVNVFDALFNRNYARRMGRNLPNTIDSNIPSECLIRISGKVFKWNEVKDTMLPFLQMLDRTYTIKHNKVAFRYSPGLRYAWRSNPKNEYILKQLLEDFELPDESVDRIEIRVRL
jgi:hypothetical protein